MTDTTQFESNVLNLWKPCQGRLVKKRDPFSSQNPPVNEPPCANLYSGTRPTMPHDTTRIGPPTHRRKWSRSLKAASSSSFVVFVVGRVVSAAAAGISAPAASVAAASFCRRNRSNTPKSARLPLTFAMFRIVAARVV